MPAGGRGIGVTTPDGGDDTAIGVVIPLLKAGLDIEVGIVAVKVDESTEADRLLLGRLRNFLVNDGDGGFTDTGVLTVDSGVGVVGDSAGANGCATGLTVRCSDGFSIACGGS